MEQTSHTLTCTIDTLELEVPIELTYLPDRRLIAGAPAGLRFSASVVFDEGFSAALIDAGVSKVDIMSMEISSTVLGAIPPTLKASLAAGINDFDLETDTDDNGQPGPHRLELEMVDTTMLIDEDADELELGLALDGIILLLGDFQMPSDCLSPTLVGFGVTFDVAQ
jgi:hypothetical protein